MKNTLFLAYVFIAISFHGLSASAMIGQLLPLSALPDYVCALKAEERIDTRISPDQKTKETIVTKNEAFCSSVLVDENYLVSAAHCQPDRIEAEKDKDSRGFTYQTVFRGKFTVECGQNDAKRVQQVFERTQMNANPLFGLAKTFNGSRSDKGYDASLLKLSQPIRSITPVKMVRSAKTHLDIVEFNLIKNTCRSFGYGRTNDGSAGKLNGAFTPITAAGTRTIISDLLPTDGRAEATQGGIIAPGDSGGALICTDAQGLDQLVGIISQAGDDFAPHSEYRAKLSAYTVPSFVESFFELVLSDQLHQSSQPYQYALDQCLKMQTNANAELHQYKKQLKKLGEWKNMIDGYEGASEELAASPTLEDLMRLHDTFYFIEQHSIRKGKNYL